MSDLLKTLTSIRALRVATKRIHSARVRKYIGEISINYKWTTSTNWRKSTKEQERLERIAKYKALLAQDGLTLTDLVDDPTFTTKRPRKKIAPRKAKYQYTDQNGKVKTWTGQGRMPLSASWIKYRKNIGWFRNLIML